MRLDCLLGSVNTKSINIVRLHEALDPCLVAGNHVRQLGVHIRERNFRVAQPAILLARDVAVIDWAVLMVMRLWSSAAVNTSQNAALFCSLVPNP